mmetsp:Transcript_59218/g.70653  ORF Transcript_59218/g.70653 Transcript_59218/m.70653 type:complete len:109 (+) Transcript_59218:59-385(+)|eukprot:CAMPEP_0172505458 /NCGR_PEP_ID=MMETSP1066-20121228/186665_1 /TAXON_ID=671091 /ORGANISM="Coscinodiscus wailesii, Strain CCMP2513" /LENGTH=108 /DNA_ID=CAMNT_0013282067 /DNA_START=49 /DNA_END=375 /DNA_ORIENTATION=+
MGDAKHVLDEVFTVFNAFNNNETVTVANAIFSPKIRADKVSTLHPALVESKEALARFYSRCWSSSLTNKSEVIDITVDGTKMGTFTAYWKADFGTFSSTLTTKVEVNK